MGGVSLGALRSSRGVAHTHLAGCCITELGCGHGETSVFSCDGAGSCASNRIQPGSTGRTHLRDETHRHGLACGTDVRQKPSFSMPSPARHFGDPASCGSPLHPAPSARPSALLGGDQAWPSLFRSGAKLVELWPKLARVGSMPAQLWPRVGQRCPNFVPRSTNFAWSDYEPVELDFGSSWPRPGQSEPSFAVNPLGLGSARFRLGRPKFGGDGPAVGWCLRCDGRLAVSGGCAPVVALGGPARGRR